MRNATKNRTFLGACLGLQLRLVRFRLLALLAMAAAVLLLSAAVAAGGRFLLGGRQFAGMDIAVASEEDDAYVDFVVDLLSSREDVSSFATIHKATAGQAEEMVREGRAHVALVFPTGFTQSVMRGENLSPRLVVDASRPLETMLIAKLAEDSVRMLAQAQQGIGYTLAVYDAKALQQPDEGIVIRDINFTYASWVLSRDSVFRTVQVSLPGNMGLFQHYLLSAIIFFASLCVPVLYGNYALRPQRGWIGRLRSAGCPMGTWVLAQVLVGAVALLPMLCLLALGVGVAGGGAFHLFLLPGLLLCALFLSCFGFLCCNAGSIMGAVSLVFLLSATGLLVSGLVPRVLLPAPLVALGTVSPAGWMYDALAPLFGGGVPVGNCLPLLGGTALLLAGCFLVGRHYDRRGVAA